MIKVRFANFMAAAAVLGLSGCGGGPAAGGSGGSTNPPPPTVVVNGAYTGSYTATGQTATSVMGALTATSPGYFVDANGFVFVVPPVPSSGTLSGTVTGYAPPGETFSSGSAVQTFSISGSATGANGSAVSGTLTGGGITANVTLASSPITSPTLAALAGSYTGFYTGSTQATLSVTLKSDGTFTGFDSFGCSLTGTVATATGGMFTLTATSSGSGCAGTVTGLSFASSSDLGQVFSGAAGSYLYVGASNATSAFAAELKHQ